MKVIAVSQRVDAVPERGEYRDALDQRLCAFLLAAGYLPTPIPNGLQAAENAKRHLDPFDRWIATVGPAGFVLSGGDDIGHRPERDATEIRLLHHAAAQHLPVLGICRGMQMMGHWAGAERVPVTEHAGTRHRVTGSIEGEKNSYHRQALASCPRGFEILCTSEDGSIEAIRHASLPWEGWMWHPEREHPFDRQDVLRLRALMR